MVAMRMLKDDLVSAVRSLRKHPSFAIFALLTLALSIGVTTAVLSVADATLLRAPAVEEPEELVAVWTTCRRGFPRCASSYLDLQDYRDQSESLTDLAGYTWTTVNLGSDEGSRSVLAQATSGNYFGLLGVKPEHGRLLSRADETGEQGPVVVLGHELWREMGSETDLIGRSIRLNGSPFTVIGVAPAGFYGLHIDGGPDLYVPLAANTALGLDPERFEARSARWIAQLVGRLDDGVTVEQARAEMSTISDRLATADPAARGPRTITVEPIQGHIRPSGEEDSLAQFVLILTAIAGSALLIGAANLANLLLARAADRQREIATRLALGAGHRRLLTQMLTESVLLSLAGGIAGLLVAQWTLHFFAAFELPGSVRIDSLGVSVDERMLVIALSVSLLTGLLFGLLPAWRAARSDVLTGLHGSRAGDSAGSMTWRYGLVASQVALCFVLLLGAGLFLRTVENAYDVDLGFRTRHVTLAKFDLSRLQYSPERAVQFVQDLKRQAEALPGADRATVATLTPLGTDFRGTFISVQGYQPGPDEEMRADYLFVDEDYFSTLAIPLLQGEGLRADLSPADAKVAVINRWMADSYWPGQSAVGGVIEWGEAHYEVVGVAEDLHWRGLVETPTPYIFFPLGQHPEQATRSDLTLAVHAPTSAAAVQSTLLQTFFQLDRELSVDRLETMEGRLGGVLMPQRMGTVLLSILAGLMVALTALGIYGIVTFTVVSRRRELGIRLALGAQGVGLTVHVIRDMATAILIGAAVGLGITAICGPALEHFLYGITPTDPGLTSIIGAFLCAVALIASLLPMRQAVRTPPVDALRGD